MQIQVDFSGKCLRDFTFQQDIVLTHISKSTKAWLIQTKEFWNGLSRTNLNPIKNLWGKLKWSMDSRSTVYTFPFQGNSMLPQGWCYRSTSLRKKRSVELAEGLVNGSREGDGSFYFSCPLLWLCSLRFRNLRSEFSRAAREHVAGVEGVFLLICCNGCSRW